jgi:Rrf2 family protein
VRLSSQQEYGLRCLLRIAERADHLPASSAAIAEAEGISPEYATRLMGPLCRGGLAIATRGPAGGYRLTRPAAEISMLDALEVLGDLFFEEAFCEHHSGHCRECARAADCSLRAVWEHVDHAMRGLFAHISLADLQRPEASVVPWLTAENLGLIKPPHDRGASR